MLALTQYIPFIPLGLLVALGLISLLTTVLNAALALVPKPWRDAVVKRYPWTGRVANMLRAGGTHLTEFLTQAYLLIAQKPIPPDANDQAAKFVQSMASRFPPNDSRRMALEYTAAQIAARVHLQAAPKQSNHGFVRGRPMLLVAALALAAAGASSLHACSASQVHTQAVIATGASDGFNRAQDKVLHQYEVVSQAAARAVCCERAQMEAAAAVVDRQWQPVIASWELARLAHDRWRTDLMACQQTIADGGVCTIDLAAEERAFLEAAGGARCVFVQLGQTDPLAALGPPDCASASPSPSPASNAPSPSAPVSVPSPRVPSLAGGAS